jgi:predicted flap endonuclease-1-like 5' DNA nuclease
MTSTGWIILVIAVVAILILIFLLKGRGAMQKPAEPQVTARVSEPAPAPRSVSTPTPTPAPTPAPAPVAPPTPQAEVAVQPPAPPTGPQGLGEPDDLRRMKGVGPKIVSLLNAEGITHFAQIAAWTDADMAAFDAKLGSFSGRPKRDNWVDQARLLAAGDTAAYEAKYGKL